MTADTPNDAAQPRTPTALHWVLWGALGAVVLSIVGFAVWVQLGVTPNVPLPVIATVPDFELIDRDGEPLGRQDLLGTPWIADFIFTRCAAICPRMTHEMRQVSKALGPSTPVRFTSITVDPEHDTPEVLEAWAQRFEAGHNWHFLTGEQAAILSLARDGFLLGVDVSPGPESVGPDPIVHSNRFALVDADGQIRGFYDPFDPESVEKLLRDVRFLVR